MNEEKKQAVMMTEAQLAEYEAYQRAKAAKTAKEQAKRDRAAYGQLVDEEVTAALPRLKELSGTISAVKGEILERFSAILQMKADVLRRVKEDQKSHTFTTSDGTRRMERHRKRRRRHCQRSVPLAHQRRHHAGARQPNDAVTLPGRRREPESQQGPATAQAGERVERRTAERRDHHHRRGLYPPIVENLHLRRIQRRKERRMETDPPRHDRGMKHTGKDGV